MGEGSTGHAASMTATGGAAHRPRSAGARRSSRTPPEPPRRALSAVLSSRAGHKRHARTTRRSKAPRAQPSASTRLTVAAHAVRSIPESICDQGQSTFLKHRCTCAHVSVRGNALTLSGAGAPHAEMATLRCSARGRGGRGVHRARSPLSGRLLGRYCGRRPRSHPMHAGAHNKTAESILAVTLNLAVAYYT